MSRVTFFEFRKIRRDKTHFLVKNGVFLDIHQNSTQNKAFTKKGHLD